MIGIGQYGSGQYARYSFGGGQPYVASFVPGKRIAVIGDPSTHGGVLSDSGGNALLKCNGVYVAVDGASHACPVPFHGTTPVVAITVKTRVNGKLIITYGAQAGCGAIITPPARHVSIEQ